MSIQEEAKRAANADRRGDKRQAPPAYSKQQYLTSEGYTHLEKDMIEALLEEGRLYTHAELQQIINSFINQEAK